MDCFIKKIADGNIDKSVHFQFIKFSRGEFKDRALVSATKTKNKFSISTSYEYANELVRAVAEEIPEKEKVKVTGAIISTRNLKEFPEFSHLLANCEVKQFQGVKRFIIDTYMDKKEILGIYDRFPKAFFALSFSTKDTELKIKPKSPKSAKAKNKEDEAKADFCKLKTSNINLVKDIIFDVPNFKKISIKHEFIITDIEIPKNIGDPAEIREKAVRKGRIIRRIIADGKESVKEIVFKA